MNKKIVTEWYKPISIKNLIQEIDKLLNKKKRTVIIEEYKTGYETKTKGASKRASKAILSLLK